MNNSDHKFSNQTTDLWDAVKLKWLDESANVYEKDVIAHILCHTEAFDKAVSDFAQIEPMLRSALKELSLELQKI